MVRFSILHNPVNEAKKLVAEKLTLGQVAVDATAGNGHDTLFLAQLVGPQGHVYAFDVQQQAIDNCRERLRAEGALQQVTLVLDSHANLAQYVPEPIDVAMFNLGYLPGADHLLITQPSSTLQALQAALELLAPGGLISLVLYPGHSGGDVEAGLVDAWAKDLSSKDYTVIRQQFWNRKASAPYLIMIEKANN